MRIRDIIREYLKEVNLKNKLSSLILQSHLVFFQILIILYKLKYWEVNILVFDAIGRLP